MSKEKKEGCVNIRIIPETHERIRKITARTGQKHVFLVEKFLQHQISLHENSELEIPIENPNGRKGCNIRVSVSIHKELLKICHKNGIRMTYLTDFFLKCELDKAEEKIMNDHSNLHETA